MANAAVACAERATNDMLIGPDWAINIELCDILNMDPGQTKDVMKVLKKRLGTKNPKIQLLTLFVLETLSKNCGDHLHQQIVERDVLHEMVKVVKKKPDLNVREKILILIDTWQEAFGGAGGRYPQYHAAYRELRAAGVEFPPRAENTSPLFTPPQTHPITYPADNTSTYHDAALEASLQSDVSTLSVNEIQNARGIVDVLTEMLSALDPNNAEGVKQEIIVDLVEQCRTYQKQVMHLVNNTGDEGLLFQALALNDDLQRVLERHDELAKGSSAIGSAPVSAAPLVNVSHEEDELEDDFSQLSRRTRDSSSGLTRKSSVPSTEQKPISPLLPPPPSSKKPISIDAGPVDYLSGDAYGSEKPTEKHAEPPPPPALSMASPPPPSSSPSLYPTLPQFDDEPIPTSKPVPEPIPKAPWDTQPSGSLPPPPSKYNQRQQFFEQQQASSGSNTSSPYNDLLAQAENLALYQEDTDIARHHVPRRLDVQESSSTPTKQTKQEDMLFKDLVDFAKAKSSSPAKPSSQRTR
ncbi:TOM1-like protein 3 [Dioscorea cayenensis subsp. rotundata]|uniref:TOM1-like protein 3 n=1 Tax=Dioscorea cayennensis subsp. rotundata TaxID=55577 RepID=A0AB40AQR9_DIOCR|nr:TOM1-like protein 3 [Dioscorea cayenensis subsp. rotundata]XP_039117095.1 TOM1-like protein 3 [Dioscorea cayenensis subsp. rotundata]